LKRSNRLILLIGVFLAALAFVFVVVLLSGDGGRASRRARRRRRRLSSIRLSQRVTSRSG
jgi:hypothetical protein